MDHLHFAIKPVMQGENLWTWGSVMSDNGYGGCINPISYFEDEILIKEELLIKIGLLKQLVILWSKLLELTKNK